MTTRQFLHCFASAVGSQRVWFDFLSSLVDQSEKVQEPKGGVSVESFSYASVVHVLAHKPAIRRADCWSRRTKKPKGHLPAWLLDCKETEESVQVAEVSEVSFPRTVYNCPQPKGTLNSFHNHFWIHSLLSSLGALMFWQVADPPLCSFSTACSATLPVGPVAPNAVNWTCRQKIGRSNESKDVKSHWQLQRSQKTRKCL